jgi:hypothetical protein
MPGISAGQATVFPSVFLSVERPELVVRTKQEKSMPPQEFTRREEPPDAASRVRDYINAVFEVLELLVLRLTLLALLLLGAQEVIDVHKADPSKRPGVTIIQPPASTEGAPHSRSSPENKLPAQSGSDQR